MEENETFEDRKSGGELIIILFVIACFMVGLSFLL